MDMKRTHLSLVRQSFFLTTSGELLNGSRALTGRFQPLHDAASRSGMEAFRLADLPLPPEDPQIVLPFDPPGKNGNIAHLPHSVLLVPTMSAGRPSIRVFQP
jgi:hypothetical protein